MKIVKFKTWVSPYHLESTDGIRGFYYRRKLKKALELAGTGGVALDLGCGTGNFLPTLSKYYNEVVALDKKVVIGSNIEGVSYADGQWDKSYIMKTLVNVVEDMVRIEKLNNVRVVQADALETGLPNNYFDVVFMMDVLEYIKAEDRRAALFEVERILKPDGILIVSIPNNGSKVLQFILKLYGIKDLHEGFRWEEAGWDCQNIFSNEGFIRYPSFFSLSFLLKLQKRDR